MTVVTVEVRLDERDVRAMEKFMRDLAEGKPINGSGRVEDKARQRCKRYGYAYFQSKHPIHKKGWVITDAGREYVQGLA